MKLKCFENVEKFYKLAEPFLLEREADHNLILGICANLRRHLDQNQQQPYLALIQKGEIIAAVAVMTPPQNLEERESLAK